MHPLKASPRASRAGCDLQPGWLQEQRLILKRPDTLTSAAKDDALTIEMLVRGLVVVF
jgi:hypothetical protein